MSNLDIELLFDDELDHDLNFEQMQHTIAVTLSQTTRPIDKLSIQFEFPSDLETDDETFEFHGGFNFVDLNNLSSIDPEMYYI